MSHESAAHGQLSPPDSYHEEHYPAETHHGTALAHPYATPPMRPTHAYSYVDPEEYQLHQVRDYYDDEHSEYQPEAPYRTPPQPIRGSGIQTRSGRSLGTPIGSVSPVSRPSPSPRSKRNRKGKDKGVEYKIDQPLSVLTKDYDVPVDDMDAWVNRSAEERQEEVRTKHKGKVPRPMNSFMLYRRAYKERIKFWGAQGDNNQLISSVAGISWNLESPSLKEWYAKIALIERDNHARAFPNYKFAPNKNVKKRDRDDDDESDIEWDGCSSYSTKRRRGRHDRDITMSRSPTPGQLMYGSPQYHPSSYQASNLHFMMPQFDNWSQPVPYNQQYEYEQYAYPRHTQVYAPTSVPMHQEQYGSQLVGLPPANESMMEGGPISQPEFAIDPGLGEYAAPVSYHYGSFDEGRDRDRDRHDDQTEYEAVGEPAMHPGMQTLAPAESDWSSGGHLGSAFDAELNRWDGSI